MSKFKVGDKVRALETCRSNRITKGEVYEVVDDQDSDGIVGIEADDGERAGVCAFRFEAAPKGTFERLLIESLPQGGYKVTASGATYALTHQELAAFTTLPEAVAFVGRNMR